MLKRLGAVIAVAIFFLLLTPTPAHARVHFGVFVGPPAPVYTPPPYVYSPYDPYNPYTYAVPYSYPYYGGYYGFVSPYSYWGHRDHDHDHWRGFRGGEHYEHGFGHGEHRGFRK
jgi:hypothetical protein